MGAVAGVAVAAGTALAALGGASIKAAGDFQSSMTSLVTGAGESQKNLQMVSDGILKISTQTGTTAQDLTQAMYLIESSGQHGAAGLQVLQTATEGAKVGNADLATTANALTTVLTDYHQPASAAVGDMNALITAVADGKTHMQDMASAMGSVLPLASSLGISFPQVSGAIAVMTNAGMDAQRASQNLANAIRSLAAPNATAQNSMLAVGLSAQQLKDTLTTQGLAGAIQLIEDHVGKKFPAGSVQAVEAFKAIMGGATGYNVALMLGGKNMSAYEGNIKNITAAMDAGGNSVRGWDLIQEDFNFQMDRAKAALDAFMISIGEKLLPLITPIVKGFTDIVSKVTDFITNIGNAGSSGDAFGGILKSIGVSSQTANNIMGLLNVTFHYLGDIANEVGNIFSTVFGAGVKIAGDLLGAFINGPLSNIIAGLNGALFAIDQFGSQVSDFMSQLSNLATSWGQNLGTNFETGLISVLADIIAVVEQVAQEIANYLGFASPTKKGPGSRAHLWGPALMSTLANGITANTGLVTDAVLGVAQQLHLASTTGGSLHTAMASMVDTASGDNMTATVIPNAVSTATSPIAQNASTSGTTSGATLTNNLATSLKYGAATVATAATAVASTLTAVCKQAKATSSCASSALTTDIATKIKSETSTTASAASAHAATVAAAHAKTVAAHQAAAQQKAAAHQAALAAKHQAAQHAALKRQEAHNAALQAAQLKHQQVIEKQAAAQQAKLAARAAKAGPAPVAGALPNMGSIGSGLKNSVAPIADVIKKATDSLKQLGDAATSCKNNVADAFTNMKLRSDGLQKGLQPLFNWLKTTFQPAWDAMVVMWETHLIPDWDKIKKAIEPALPSLKAIGQIFLQLMGMGILGFFDFLAKNIEYSAGVIGQLVDGFTWLVTSALWVIQQLQPVWDGIVAGFQWLYDQLLGHSIIPDIINGIQTWWKNLLGFFPGIMGQIQNTLIQWWNNIESDVKTFWQKVQTVFNSAWTTYISKPVTSLWTNVQNVFNSAWPTYIAPALAKVASDFQQWLTTQANNFGTWAKNAMTMFATNITNGAPSVIQAITKFGSNIASLLGFHSPPQAGPLAQSGQWMPNMMTMLEQGISTGVSSVLAPIASMRQSMNQQFLGLSTQIQASVGTINTSLNVFSGTMRTVSAKSETDMASLRNQMAASTNQINAAIMGMGRQASTTGQWIVTANRTTAASTDAMGQQTGQTFKGMASNATSSTQIIINAYGNVGSTSINVGGVMKQTAATAQSTSQTTIQAMGNVGSTSIQTAGQVQSSSQTSAQALGAVGSASTQTAGQVQSSNQLMQQSLQAVAAAGQSTSQSMQASGSATAGAMEGSTAVVDSATARQEAAALKAQQAAQTAALNAAQSAKKVHDSSSSTMKSSNDMLQSIAPVAKEVPDIFSSALASVSSFSQQIEAKALSAVQAAQSMAQSLVNNLGHSKPKEGPLKDDDLWGKHFMQNIVSGMQSGMPALKSATNQIATALQEGYSLTNVKQHGDDITALLQKITTVKGLSMTTTANIAGDIPISYALTPQTQSTQNMTIHFDLDGKPIGKYIGKYINSELRVQGVVRG
jgi:TP901 family phage tail tape measure protein